MNLRDAERYCWQKLRSSRSSFYASFRFLPEQKRRAMVILYAFCREIDDIVDEPQNEVTARQTLEQWRQRIDDLSLGKVAHPITVALQPILAEFNLPISYFHELIDGMEMDLDHPRYADFKALQLYCYRVASVVGLLAVEIFGYQHRDTRKYAYYLGLAFQLTNILRDVYEDSQRGRIYIPEDELARFGVSVAHLQMRHSSPELKALFAFQAQRAAEYYDKALSILPQEDRAAQRAGLVMAAIYREILHDIEKIDYAVLKHRVRLSMLRKIWIAWRTVSDEKKRLR